MKHCRVFMMHHHFYRMKRCISKCTSQTYCSTEYLRYRVLHVYDKANLGCTQSDENDDRDDKDESDWLDIFTLLLLRSGCSIAIITGKAVIRNAATPFFWHRFMTSVSTTLWLSTCQVLFLILALRGAVVFGQIWLSVVFVVAASDLLQKPS